MKNLVLILSIAFVLTESAHALVAPWYQYFNLVQSTLGSDPCVKPEDLKQSENGFILNLKVCDQEKAVALKTILLNRSQERVEISVEGPSGLVEKGTTVSSPEKLKEVLDKAFTGNPYFSESALTSHSHPNVWLEFSKKVVQFYTDNISDRYGSRNEVAQHAFDKVLDLNQVKPLRVFTTTKRE